MAPKDATQALTIPLSLVSRVDAVRLARELEAISTESEQQGHHHTKTATPSASPNLKELLDLNQLKISHADDRDRLYKFLVELKKDAPTIHMSFAAEPPSTFTSKLVGWLRTEVHPLLLLDVGLQPTIAAGCIIRTTSKYFDCSMRQHLVQNKPKLLELLRGTSHA